MSPRPTNFVVCVLLFRTKYVKIEKILRLVFILIFHILFSFFFLLFFLYMKIHKLSIDILVSDTYIKLQSYNESWLLSKTSSRRNSSIEIWHSIFSRNWHFAKQCICGQFDNILFEWWFEYVTEWSSQIPIHTIQMCMTHTFVIYFDNSAKIYIPWTKIPCDSADLSTNVFRPFFFILRGLWILEKTQYKK